MADRLSVCYVCGIGLPSRDARRAHYAAEHPKHRVTWRGRNPLVIDPDGTEREIDKTTEARMRRVAIRAALAKGSRRIEDLTGAAAAATSSGSGIGSTSTGREAADPAAPPPPGPRSGVTVRQAPIRPTGAATAAPTREAVREALEVGLLADIIRDFSIALSEADGAGEAGHLSHIQARQVATLAYDATVDFIVDRFGGNVTRFKLALACLIILAAKGRVHIRAIAAKARRSTDDLEPGALEPPLADDWTGPPHPDDALEPVEPETAPSNGAAPPDPVAAVAELAERQAAWARRNR
jgi:hypothetical protein